MTKDPTDSAATAAAIPPQHLKQHPPTSTSLNERAPSAGGFSYRDLKNSHFERPRPVVEGLVHEGHACVLGGAFGAGKTFFGMQLSIALATGQDFLGRKVARPYKTTFLDTENGKGEITGRVVDLVEQCGLSPQAQARLNQNWRLVDYEDEGPLQWLNLDKAEGFKKLGEYVEKNGTEVLVVDCLGKVFLAKESDESRIKIFCDRITKLRREHGSLKRGVIFLLHHVTKHSTDSAGFDLLEHPWEWLSTIRGSGRLLDFIQDRLGIDELRGSDTDTHHVVNGIIRSGKVSPFVLQRSETGFFELHDDKDFVVSKVFSGSPRKRELFDLISLNLLVTFRHAEVAALQDSSGKPFSQQTISDTLRLAVANGLIAKNGDGSYTRPSSFGPTPAAAPIAA